MLGSKNRAGVGGVSVPTATCVTNEAVCNKTVEEHLRARICLVMHFFPRQAVQESAAVNVFLGNPRLTIAVSLDACCADRG